MASVVSSRNLYFLATHPHPMFEPCMLARPKVPRLKLTSGNSSEVSALCVACGRVFHAYVRTCEKDAIVRLQRNFRLHARLAHGQVPNNTRSEISFDPDLARAG